MTHTVMVMDQARKVTWELPVPPPLVAGVLPPVPLLALACLFMFCFPLQSQGLRGRCSGLDKVLPTGSLCEIVLGGWAAA